MPVFFVEKTGFRDALVVRLACLCPSVGLNTGRRSPGRPQPAGTPIRNPVFLQLTGALPSQRVLITDATSPSSTLRNDVLKPMLSLIMMKIFNGDRGRPKWSGCGDIASSSWRLLSCSACQPIPPPFRATARAPQMALLNLADFRGIMILPVAFDAPPATAEKLAAAMAEALIERNVPAFVGNQQSLHSRFCRAKFNRCLWPRCQSLPWTLFRSCRRRDCTARPKIEGTTRSPSWAIAGLRN